MIEKTLADYLKSKTRKNVYFEHPENGPACYYIVDKIGSSMEDRLKSTQFIVQSIAPNLSMAAAMNKTAIDVMLDAVELDEVSGVWLDSDYNYSESGSLEYRYQAVFNIFHY